MKYRATFIGVLLVMLCVQCIRQWYAGSLWFDELNSLHFATRPVSEIVTFSARDSHPPLYTLMLKGWMELGEFFGIISTRWVRSMNLAGWLVASVVAYAGTASLMKRESHEALLAGILVACGAALSSFTKDLRNYAFAVPAGFCLFMILCWVDAYRDSRSQRIGWIAYALVGAFALWQHLLMGIVLFLLGLLWIVLCVIRRRESGARGFLTGGFVANTAIVLLFLPWVQQVHSQWGFFNETLNSSWMTPPAVRNVMAVFIFFVPGGSLTGITGRWATLLRFMGLIAMLFPVCAGAWSWMQARRLERIQFHGACGIIVSSVFIVMTWALARFGGVPIFHAPRYQIIIAPIFLWSLAAWTFGGEHFRIWRHGLLLAPLLLMGGVGIATQIHWERSSRLATISAHEDMFPQKGARIYAEPNALLPYIREIVPAGWEIVSWDFLADLKDGADNVTVLQFGNWWLLWTPEDIARRDAIGSEKLSANPETVMIGARLSHDAFIRRMEKVNAAAVREAFGSTASASQQPEL